MRNCGLRRAARGMQGIWLVVMLAVCAVVNGTAATPEQQQPAPSRPLVQQKQHGDVHLKLEAHQRRIALGDRLFLTLSVEAPPDMQVTLPGIEPRLGPFTVVRHTSPAPRTIAPKVRQWRQEYVLEPQASGTQVIPRLTIAFQPGAAPQTQAAQQLSTDPLRIMVTTVLPDNADLTAPKDIASPVALPRPGLPVWLWLGAALLLVLILVAGFWWWQRRRRPRQGNVPRRPAHLLALEALQRLQIRDLATQQRIENFYVQVSNITRRYIEWRFGLRAPEQTTEEFLAAALDAGGLLGKHQELLSAFLHQCDQVKFARHQPTPDDMQQILDHAKVFIEQTADEQITVAATALEGAAA